MNVRILLAIFYAMLANGGFVASAQQLLPLPGPGRLLVERPTLNCLGVRWYLDDLDPEREARCSLAYRAAGQQEWRRAHPLLRIGGEHVGRGEEIEWTTPHLLAGSVLGLEPDTEYELRLTLTGVSGEQSIVRVLKCRTRALPSADHGGAKAIHVHEGQSIREAYTQAQPGDTIVIHAGVFRIPEDQKIGRADYVFDKQATVDRPIILRAAPDSIGKVILDGDGASRLIDCHRATYHYFQGIVFEDADHLLYAGRDGDGAEGLAVMRCTFRDALYPIFGVSSECRDFYIADSTFIGPAVDRWHPRDESRKARGGDTHAIWLMGQGHVVCHNRISGWWDGIDIIGGKPSDDIERQNCSIDFYGNEISEIIDDAIELDFGVHNLRVWDNRIYNTFMGISAQPVYGGPAYIVRNVVYNCTRSPLKPNRWPAGLLVYNNTFVCADSAGRWSTMWQNTHILNNLFVGKEGGAGVIWTGTPTPETSRMDYNGWRLHKSSEPYPIWWQFPKPRRVWSGSAEVTECVYHDLAQFTADTGFEQHGVIIDYDVFVKCEIPSGAMTPLPAIDLRLREGSAAIDSGIAIPNITDHFAGAAPDLGAYEFDSPQIGYGPRR